MTRRMYVVGNWKMHGSGADIPEIAAIASASRGLPQVDVALCVPATLIERAARAVPGFAVGAQDVHHDDQGAHTGCVSVGMLLDAGASLTILGHSERREAQHESDEEVRRKVEIALPAGLRVILCVGESETERASGNAVGSVVAQLEDSLPKSLTSEDFVPTSLAVAYEPIWAIGTGKVPTLAEIAEMHAALRQRLIKTYGEDGAQVRILYGGSVKASNAAEIFALDTVDGALVGGASLKAADFVPIVEAAARVKADTPVEAARPIA